jgi:Gas vesicle protein
MSEPLELIASSETSLLDTVDHLLNKGVVLTGEVVIGLAGIDLIYLRLTALLCAADRILPKVSGEGPEE